MERTDKEFGGKHIAHNFVKTTNTIYQKCVRYIYGKFKKGNIFNE